MGENILDAILGKQYDLQALDNNLVTVESAGHCIRVGIKDESGKLFSFWEPAYPFTPPPASVKWPTQNGWNFTVEAPTPELTRGIFEKEGKRHVLTLQILDPNASPKPVQITWE